MATYYVSLAGSDANSCAAAQNPATPKRTIANALGCVAAGDTLYIREGTYDEVVDGASFTATGISWATPITVAAFPGETVTVRPTSGPGNALRLLTGTPAYVIFDRLLFDGELCGGDGGSAVVYLEAATHHLRFSRCHMRNGAGNGVLATLGSTALEFLDCEAYRNGLFAGYTISIGFYLECSNSLVRGGRFYNNEAFGVRVYASAGTTSNTIVEGVTCFQNGYGLGLDGASVSAAGGGGIVVGDLNQIVRNCVVYNNYSGIWAYTESSNVRLYHNTVVNNVNEGILLQFFSDGPTVINNILFGNGLNPIQNYGGTGTPTEEDNLFTDPSFTSLPALDFTLQAGSAARDAGQALPSVTQDFAGLSRPQGPGWDIGAYEFPVGVPPVGPDPATLPRVYADGP